MENFSTELGPEAMFLVGIIAILVQHLKRFEFLSNLKEKMPVFVVAAIALGLAAAYYAGIPNPVVAGVMMGLMSSGAYSAAKNGKA